MLIVSLCISPLERISQYINYFIKLILTYTHYTTSVIIESEQNRAYVHPHLSLFVIFNMYTHLHNIAFINVILTAFTWLWIWYPGAYWKFEFNGQIFWHSLSTYQVIDVAYIVQLIYEIVPEILKRFSSVNRDDRASLIVGI